MINVNEDKGAEILKRCRTLREYSQFIATAKRNIRNGMEARDAIEAAVRECIENDILKDFLLENGGEVVSAFYKELTRAEIEEIRRRDGFAEGHKVGMEEGHRAGFEDGNNAGKLEIAQNMKRSGMANDTIAELTRLPIEQIEQL